MACPRCRNPVLVAAPPAAAEAERAVPAALPSRPPKAGGAGWALVGAALGVLALAHVGLWALLTAAARSGVAEAEERYDVAEMERELAVKEVPAADGGFAELRRQQVREAARRWHTDRRHVSLMTYSLFGAYALQAGIVVLLRLRSSRASRERATRPVG